MILFRTRSLSTVAVMLALAVLMTGTAFAAKAGSQVYQGIVKHISADNIKVYDPSDKKTQSFLIVPHFGSVFKADGHTPAQMKEIAAGQYVKVYYDQKALGAFHADRILILNNGNMVEKSTKS